MNAAVRNLSVSPDLEAEGRRAVLENFKAEEIQHLGKL